MSIKILLLEDDKLFNETLQDFLEEEGFIVDSVFDPYSALDLTYERNYELYLFDVNLPYESGFELLEKLRSSGNMTPAIFLTSRDDKESLKDGFSSGADDYMKKPIDLDELLCRIYALLRRQIREEKVAIGEYMLDIVAKKIYLASNEIDISLKAVELLMILMESKGKVVSIESIKDRLWSVSQSASDGSLRVYVTHLKRYFQRHISNVRGVGYRWDE